MKKRLFAAALCCLLLIACCAAADGYTDGDHWERPAPASGVMATAEVIARSVTLREEPSTSAKKIASIPSEEVLMVLDTVGDSWLEVQWSDKGKSYTGFVRAQYVVVNPEYITLRLSNTPAYSVPSRDADVKLVGSLAKMTRLRVIGVWEDFYCVYLRGGAAFIHMDSEVWTETELNWLRQCTYVSALGGHRGSAARKTALRTGPGKGWPEILTIKSGQVLDVSVIEQDGWVFVKDLEGNAGYVPLEDVR